MACPAAAFSGVRTSRSVDRRRELFIGGLNQAIWPQQPGYGTVIGPVPPSPRERSGGQTSTASVLWPVRTALAVTRTRDCQ
jgi:hypothetical protein